jgi:hypothetical protein
MSQVFSVLCIDDQMGPAFQGFYKRGRSTQPMLLPRGLATLHLAGLRRGLASLC